MCIVKYINHLLTVILFYDILYTVLIFKKIGLFNLI